MTRLIHYYHIYAQGRWQQPFNEHLAALTDSGLLDNLDFIGIGIVGSASNRTKVKEVLPFEFNVVAEKASGWEQVTLTPLSKDLQEPAKILYAHTKGAANNSHNQDLWRKEMTQGTVYHWRNCLELLDKYDAVGCRWRRDPWRHFSGTFWWANSSYLSTLAPISYSYRDDAEAWIGQGSEGGTHAEIDPACLDLNVKVHSFGRTFVARRTVTGYSNIIPPDLYGIMPGDEFVGLSPTEGNKIISCLLKRGMSCSLKGNTIIVNK